MSEPRVITSEIRRNYKESQQTYHKSEITAVSILQMLSTFFFSLYSFFSLVLTSRTPALLNSEVPSVSSLDEALDIRETWSTTSHVHTKSKSLHPCCDRL
jgi:hypothetical protein